MKAKKLTVNMPSVEELIGGLDPEQDHEVVEATQQLAEAEQQVEQARQRLAEHDRAVEELPEAVRAGEAPEESLAEALDRQRSSTALVPACEAHLAAARQKLQDAQQKARAAVAAEAGQRVAALQKVADKLAPTLEALRKAEVALQSRITATCSYTQRIGNQQLPVAGPNLPSLSWPASLADDGCYEMLAAPPMPAPHHHQRRRSA